MAQSVRKLEQENATLRQRVNALASTDCSPLPSSASRLRGQKTPLPPVTSSSSLTPSSECPPHPPIALSGLRVREVILPRRAIGRASTATAPPSRVPASPRRAPDGAGEDATISPAAASAAPGDALPTQAPSPSPALSHLSPSPAAVVARARVGRAAGGSVRLTAHDVAVWTSELAAEAKVGLFSHYSLSLSPPHV